VSHPVLQTGEQYVFVNPHGVSIFNCNNDLRFSSLNS
jgi:hypothetical protein